MLYLGSTGQGKVFALLVNILALLLFGEKYLKNLSLFILDISRTRHPTAFTTKIQQEIFTAVFLTQNK